MNFAVLRITRRYVDYRYSPALDFKNEFVAKLHHRARLWQLSLESLAYVAITDEVGNITILKK